MQDGDGEGFAQSAPSTSLKEKALDRLFLWPTFVVKVFLRFLMSFDTVMSQRNNGLNSHPTAGECEAIYNGTRQELRTILQDLDHVANQVYHYQPPCQGSGRALSGQERSWLRSLGENLDGLSVSTCFSGIETPGTALLMLGHAVSLEQGVPFTNSAKVRHNYAVEVNAHARSEILNHPGAPEHVFGDIEEFWSDALKSKIKHLEANKLVKDVLIPLIKAANCTGTKAWCYKHEAYCKAGVQRIQGYHGTQTRS